MALRADFNNYSPRLRRDRFIRKAIPSRADVVRFQFGYRKSVTEIGGLGVGVCRKRRKRPYRSSEIGRPNIFARCKRFNLMTIYLRSYRSALGGWVADSGLLVQLEGLKALLSGLPRPLSPERVAYLRRPK